MSNDVNAMSAASKAILLNREVLAIDQDPLGRMCFRFLLDRATGKMAWKKDLVGGDVAVALVNMGNATVASMGFAFDQVGFAPDTIVAVRDVFTQTNLGTFTGEYTSTTGVESHGVHLLRLSFVPKYPAADGIHLEV